MFLQKITDRNALADYFRLSPEIHFYSLGDLDDRFWPRTSCYGFSSGGVIRQAVTLYKGPGLPVLLAFSGPNPLEEDLFRQLIPLLPDSFYAHLSPDLEAFFQSVFNRFEYGDHLKMVLSETSRIRQVKTSGTVRLTEEDLPEILELYHKSAPENGFDPALLKTGLYYGIRQSDRLVSIAGVHVLSRTYGAAALGNVTTHPDYRNQGWGKMVTARVCQELVGQIKTIGLNVKKGNLPAIKLYSVLGFRITSAYGEFSFQKKAKTA